MSRRLSGTRLRSGPPGLAAVFAAVVLALALGCAGPGAHERRPPRIRFESLAHDFAPVDQGEAVDAAFELRNEGELDLEIAALRSAEDCAARIDGPARIRPGGTATVRARFDTAAVFGSQERTVTVYSNDPDQRAITLEIRGEVRLDVASDPPRLYAGSVPRGTRVPRTIAVRAGEATRVTALRTSAPLLVAELIEAPGASAPPSVSVAISPDAPLGPFGADVELLTTSVRRPVVRVPVSGIIVPDVRVTPARLEFGAVGLASAPSRLLLVENLRQERPVHVTAVEIDERLGTARLEALEEGVRYRIRATLGDRLAAGHLTGVVRLHTDHPEQPIIEVPVDATVSGAS